MQNEVDPEQKRKINIHKRSKTEFTYRDRGTPKL